MSFRDNLREALDFTGTEQKELAAKTGISLKTIESYVKKDSSVPSADKAVLIAQALGVTVEYLITGKRPKKADFPIIQSQHKELLDLVSKLNKYNQKIITNTAKMLFTLQTEAKSQGKESQ
jgi:transcriptional regulator with XRE-family HTH domain